MPVPFRKFVAGAPLPHTDKSSLQVPLTIFFQLAGAGAVAYYSACYLTFSKLVPVKFPVSVPVSFSVLR